jgi:hypothetical protein
MSAYDQKVWESLGEQILAKQERRFRVPEGVKNASKRVTRRTGQAWESLPGHVQLAARVEQALEGFRTLTLDPALASVRQRRVLDAYDKKYGVSLDNLSDIRNFRLEQCDRAVPNLRMIYSVGSGLEGAARPPSLPSGLSPQMLHWFWRHWLVWWLTPLPTTGMTSGSPKRNSSHWVSFR